MTKTEAKRLAVQARRYGYYKTSDTEGYVHCPACRARVVFYKFAWERFTAAVMDAAVVEHLLDDEACAGAGGRR